MVYNVVSVLRQQFKLIWRLYGVIIDGGNKLNIIFEKVLLVYYVRILIEEELMVFRSKVYRCFEFVVQVIGV